jgi:hypothetical protein
MAFDPKINRNEKDAIGDPGDAIATNTTEAWTSISLLKAIFGKLGGGTAATVASDVAQGSTTAGQSGGLVQGAVTTAAPTYTTAQTNPLSLETDGDLRTHDTASNAVLTSMNSTLNTLNLSTDGLEAALGIITETAPASDTASSGLNGRLQRIAQRLTSLIALLPASLGSKAAASSFAVTDSTEDIARIGIVTETAPASDTASSGLNGRLQRIAQRITSLIALVPTSLGQKTAANSFAVTLASDDAVTTAVVVDDAAFTPATTKVMMAGFEFDDVAPDSVNEGDAGAARMSANRSIYTQLRDAAGNERGANVTAANELMVKQTAPSTGSIASVAGSASDVTVLASNSSRKGATFYNDSTAILYLALANVTSSTTVYTVQIPANGYYELPMNQGGAYTGIVKGIWASATGNVRVTELT